MRKSEGRHDHASPRLLSLLNFLLCCYAVRGTKARAQRRLRPQAAMAEAKATSSGKRASPCNTSRAPSCLVVLHPRVPLAHRCYLILRKADGSFPAVTHLPGRVCNIRSACSQAKACSRDSDGAYCQKLATASGPQHPGRSLRMLPRQTASTINPKPNPKTKKKLTDTATYLQEVCVTMSHIWWKRAALKNKATFSGEK